MKSSFVGVSEAVAAIAKGEMIVVCDDKDRENEGDLVMAAEFVEPKDVNFMATHGRGLICLPMSGAMLERLEIPDMVRRNPQHERADTATAFTVSIEAKKGISTGISAADRATTIREAVDDAASPDDLATPGHVFPLRARPGGVLERPGHTEAAVDLARLAGLKPAGVICEVMNDDGTMARVPELEEFSRQHGVKMFTVAQLVEYRRRFDGRVGCAAETRLPTPYGDFRLRTYENDADSLTHLAIVMGEPEGKTEVLVRVHSACLTGEALHSLRCDCGAQLDKAMEAVAAEGEGVIIYMQQEGRGIGLADKIRAYRFQDLGADTVEANRILGYAPDLRDYGVAAQMLKELGLDHIRLLTNNPHKILSLSASGIEVAERVPLETQAGLDNICYLRTKQEKMDHAFGALLIEEAAGLDSASG